MALKEKTYLVVCPHGYDFTVFCGGMVAHLAKEGHAVHILQVTDDRKRSLDLSEEETMRRNLAESQEAASILGASSFTCLRHPEDRLVEIPWNELRGQIVRTIRCLKPYALIGFDPWAIYEEEMEHILVARIIEDACRCAGRHLYHPEQIKEGLGLHWVTRRSYFGRSLSKMNQVVDISDVIDLKIKAAQGQMTATQHHVFDFLKRLEANGLRLPLLNEDMDQDELHRHLIEQFIRRHAAETGRSAGMRMAEGFRMDRFGEMEDFVDAVAEPIKGAGGM